MMYIPVLLAIFSIVGISYCARTGSHPAVALLDNDAEQVLSLGELVDFVVSVIVYGVLLHYFLRSTRRVLLYWLLSGMTPQAAARILGVVEAPLQSINKTGYEEVFGKSQNDGFMIHDMKAWVFILCFLVLGMGLLVGLTSRSGLVFVSLAGITTFPPLYSRLSENISSIPIPDFPVMEYTTLPSKLFQAAAKVTTLTTYAILLLIPALAVMHRIRSPWFKPLSIAVVLATPLLLVQQAAIVNTWWYLCTNAVMAGYCAFLYAHFALAVFHHPRFRPVTSGLLMLGGLPFVVGKVGDGIEDGVVISEGLERRASRMWLGWWVLGGVCLLWLTVWGVLVVQVRDLLGLRIG